MKILQEPRHIDNYPQGLNLLLWLHLDYLHGWRIDEYRDFECVWEYMTTNSKILVQHSAISLRFLQDPQVCQEVWGINVDQIPHCSVFGSIHLRGALSCCPQNIVWHLSPKGQKDMWDHTRYNLEKYKDLYSIRKLKANQRKITWARHWTLRYRRTWQMRIYHCLIYDQIRICINDNFVYLWNSIIGWQERNQLHRICLARFLPYSMRITSLEFDNTSICWLSVGPSLSFFLLLFNQQWENTSNYIEPEAWCGAGAARDPR